MGLFRKNKKSDKEITENKLNPEYAKYAEELVISSNGIVEKPEALEFMEVLHTYELLIDKDECLKSFNTFANKIMNNGSSIIMLNLCKICFFIGILQTNNIINEDEADPLVKEYTKVISDKNIRDLESKKQE